MLDVFVMRNHRFTLSFAEMYISGYIILWIFIMTIMLIEILDKSSSIFGRIGWLIYICIFTGCFSVLIFLSFTFQIKFESNTERIVRCHMIYIFTLHFFFLPIAFSAALLHDTISDSRFKEYLSILWIGSLPGILVGTYFVADYQNPKTNKQNDL